MTNIIGIDLGTTFSAMAALDETGRPAIVHVDGNNITPSVVQFEDDGSIDVGYEARMALGQPNVFKEFKRDMGTSHTYNTPYGEVTPTGLSSQVLKKLKDNAEKTIGPIENVVVTTPANFANEAREATLQAAKQADLPIMFLVNEPTAAALYYAYKKGAELSGVYAVYDLGGGTFDITLIRVQGQHVEVLATDGIHKLGGTDFDRAIQDLVKRKYKEEGGADLDIEDFDEGDAEQVKIALSKKREFKARVSGPAGRKNIAVSAAEFEEAISSQLSQTEMLCESVLDELEIGASEIKEVFLVGGSTRIPSVIKSVKRVFGKEPTGTANVDEVVALGAALYAGFKADRNSLSDIQRATVDQMDVGEISSKCFGTLVVQQDDKRGEEKLTNVVLIENNTKIPTSVTRSFYTVHEGQTDVRCQITESNSPETDPRFAKVIWEGNLGPLPSDRPAGQEIQVTYSYDDNQIMSCIFKDVSSGQEQKVDLEVGQYGSNKNDQVDRFLVE